MSYLDEYGSRTSAMSDTDEEQEHNPMNKDSLIPKIIISTWIDEDIPFKYLASQLSISQQMPGYEYILLTLDKAYNFIEEYYPDYSFYFDKLPFDQQRLDVAKYLWLYRFGGIYIDLNYQLKRSLETLFDHPYPAYFLSVDKKFCNTLIAARPKCPIFLEFVDFSTQLLPWWCKSESHIIKYTTGSGMMTHVLKNTNISFNILSKDIIPCNVCEKSCNNGDYIKQVENIHYDFLSCNWQLIVITAILIISIVGYNIVRYYRKKNKKKIYVKLGEDESEDSWALKETLL
jgi:mannosyltransferase OCH1-like enzyme